MAKSKITNGSSSAFTLPPPWSRVLGPGKEVYVAGTVDETIAALGGADAITGAFIRVSTADEGAAVLGFDDDSAGIFGDGSDGALAVTATTTEAGENEMFYTDGSIGASGIYKPAGRRVFFSGTLTIEDGGIVQADGGAAVLDVAGVGGGAAAFTLAGTAANAAARIVSPTAHGAGGAGGAGTSAAGAAGAQSATKSGNMRNVIGVHVGGAAIAPGTEAARAREAPVDLRRHRPDSGAARRGVTTQDGDGQ